MFPMTVTISNTLQLNAVMAALGLAPIEPTKLTAPVEKPTAANKDAIKAEPKAEVKTESKAEAATETTPAAEQKPEALTQMTAGEAEKALHGHANNPADAPTYQATADAVTKLAREKGRDAAIAVLTKFGASKLPDVKPEQFAAVIAECEAVGA